jgi:hypothetical protein
VLEQRTAHEGSDIFACGSWSCAGSDKHPTSFELAKTAVPASTIVSSLR